MSKEKLLTMKVKELRELAKEFNISGRWDMTKSELVEAILRAEESRALSKKSAKDECEDVNQHDVLAASDKSEKNTAEESCFGYDVSLRKEYVENAKVGTIVAFVLPNGKAKSAKIEKKSSKNKKLKVVTSYGAEYVINYDDVIWVKSGKRWPKGVYKKLKGNEDYECSNK